MCGHDAVDDSMLGIVSGQQLDPYTIPGTLYFSITALDVAHRAIVFRVILLIRDLFLCSIWFET